MHASQPLSPELNEVMRKVAMMVGMESVRGLCDIVPLTKADLVNDGCPTAETNTDSLIWYYSHRGTRYFLVVGR